jgi:hypothetical protein
VGVSADQQLFDPRVLFDRASGRFFLTGESVSQTFADFDQYQYFAVSTDGTGTGWLL